MLLFSLMWFSSMTLRDPVCFSVRLSVSHVGYFWSNYTNSQLMVFAPRSHNIGNLVQGNTPKIRVE